VANAVADQAAYARSAAYRSSMRKGANRGAGSTWQDQAARDLAAMGVGMPTKAQAEMEKVFGAGKGEGEGGATGSASSTGDGSAGSGVRRKKSRRW
jgi:hypothetical protein